MGVTVTFSYPTWLALFPQFAYISSTQAQMYFDLATQWVRNDGGGPVSTAATQTTLLNLMTAHIAQLFAPTQGGQNPSMIVGRISDATQGSVSVSAAYPGENPSASWFNQTPYGAAAWSAMAPYRTARYVPGPGAFAGNPFGNPFFTGGGNWLYPASPN